MKKSEFELSPGSYARCWEEGGSQVICSLFSRMHCIMKHHLQNL